MLALGGNAMTNADGRARPEDQIAAAEVAMAAVAELIEHDVEVVITHGNGPRPSYRRCRSTGAERRPRRRSGSC